MARNTSKGARPNKSGQAGRAGRSGRSSAADRPRHPGLVLAEVLDETPPAVAAKWFGLTPEEAQKLLAGEAPFTAEIARRAGDVFGTGAAPWMALFEAWEEASAPKPAKSSQPAKPSKPETNDRND